MMADTDRHPEWDIKIEHTLGNVYGNLVDGRGQYDKTTLRQTQFSRMSLKMSQGGTKHSDYEPPYRSIEQRDWSGGRGLDDMDLDEARYFDSYRCETWKEGRIIPGPEEEYAKGIRAATDEYWWQSNNTRTRIGLYPSSGDSLTYYYSHSFVASATYTPKYIDIAIGVHSDTFIPDTALGTMYHEVHIYSDSAGEPNASLMSALPSAALTEYGTKIQRLSIGTPAQLTATTTYHIVVKGYSTGTYLTSAHHPYVMGNTIGPSTHYSSPDGTTWTAATKGLFYRIIPNETHFDAHFFVHKSCLYAALSYKDGSAPKVFKCGDRGTATSATSTTLVDTSKTWTADRWIGAIVILTSGTGANARTRWRVITDNGTTSISVADWDIQPDATTEYAIVGSQYWTEVTGHGMTKKITDVATINNIVYFCRGDDDDIFHMYNDVFAIENGNRGTFVEIAPDSNGKTKIWFAKRGFPPAVNKADPVYVEAGDSIDNLDLDHDITVLNPDMETAGDWASVGTPITSARSASAWSITPYSGSYFWSVDANAAEGIEQVLDSTSGIVDGDLYKITARVDLSDTTYTNGVYMIADSTTLDSTVGVYDQWILLSGYYRASGATLTLSFVSNGGRQQFGVDSVSVVNVSETTSAMGDEVITGITAYGEPERLWVATDGNLYMEDKGQFVPIPLKEFKNAKDDRNGRALLVHDVFLYTSFMDGLERYYKSNLNDMGPNKDEGLPSDRRGNIVVLAGYPGRFYAAVDGGISNYSSILMYNGFGWHEAYRAQRVGDRITSLFVHPIPGDYVDRLYFNEGSDICWIGIDFNPSNNPNYRYSAVSSIDLQTIYAGRQEVEKYFSQLKTSYRGYTGIRAAYGYDYANPTHVCNLYIGEFVDQPSDTKEIDLTYEFINIRLMMEPYSAILAPHINAMVIDALEHTPVKFAHSMQILMGDRKKTLGGRPSSTRYETDIDLLRSIVNSATPGTLYSPSSASSGRTVKFTGCEPRPIWINSRGQVEQAVVTITAVDV